jgi:hypothetical protein
MTCTRCGARLDPREAGRTWRWTIPPRGDAVPAHDRCPEEADERPVAG